MTHADRTVAAPSDDALGGSGQSAFWRYCGRDLRLPACGGILALLFGVCLLAPLLAPYDPMEPRVEVRLRGPSRAHLLGTDQLGRDVFSRLLWGGRTALPLGLMAVAIAATLGITLGVAAGYYGGFADEASGRLVDAQLAFPELLLALALVNTFGASLFNVMVVVGLSSYPAYYRLARGQVIAIRGQEFMTAAYALGGSGRHIMLKHVLPNILNPLIIATSLAAGSALLLQASLGFFGLGPKAGTPDWGVMFFDGLNNFRLQPWLVAGPGLAVFLSVLCFYMLGDALRDFLDPHQRGRNQHGYAS